MLAPVWTVSFRVGVLVPVPTLPALVLLMSVPEVVHGPAPPPEGACHVPLPAASEVRTKPAVGDVVSSTPVARTVRATSSFEAGDEVPTPTLAPLVFEMSFPVVAQGAAEKRA